MKTEREEIKIKLEVKGKKVVSRNSKAKKKREFAEAKNAEEADEIFPDSKKIAGKIKAKRSILAGDNLLDKFRLLFYHYDFLGYWDVEPLLSDRDMLKIKDSIKTKADLELYGECMREYQTIKRFGNRLKYCFKCFQVSYSCLAVLLNRLDEYEDFVDYTNIVGSMLTKTQKLNFINTNPSWESGAFLLDGAKMIYNEEKDIYELDDSEIYEKILTEAAVVANELADFKAHIEAADYYIENSHLKYTPISIEMSWENAILEKYTRYLVKNKRYFLSELFNKTDKGEQPTEEEKRYAVIADYQETKRNERTYIDCLEDLGYNIAK